MPAEEKYGGGGGGDEHKEDYRTYKDSYDEDYLGYEEGDGYDDDFHSDEEGEEFEKLRGAGYNSRRNGTYEGKMGDRDDDRDEELDEDEFSRTISMALPGSPSKGSIPNPNPNTEASEQSFRDPNAETFVDPIALVESLECLILESRDKSINSLGESLFFKIYKVYP